MNMDVSSSLLVNFPMTRLALISSEGAPTDDLLSILKASPRLRIQQFGSGDVHKSYSPEATDMVIFHVSRLSADELEVLGGLVAQSSGIPIIVISPQLQAEEMRRLFRFGIHDWLPTPVQPSDLFDTIHKGAGVRKASHNRVHAVISAVGGAGATTIALTMADIEASRQGKSGQTVALFDLDFSLGSCGSYANIINDFKLSSIAASPRRVDAEFIRAIQKRHQDGFYLYSFKQPDLNGELNGYELVLRMLDAVTSEHHHTFLDIPYYMTEWRDEVIAAVNTCTLVTELTLPAIKHTLDQINKIQSLRGTDFPLQVIINRSQTSIFGQRVSKKQLRSLFETVPFHYVREDDSTVGEAVDRGLLPTQVRSSSGFVKDVRKYLKTLAVVEAG